MLENLIHTDFKVMFSKKILVSVGRLLALGVYGLTADTGSCQVLWCGSTASVDIFNTVQLFTQVLTLWQTRALLNLMPAPGIQECRPDPFPGWISQTRLFVTSLLSQFSFYYFVLLPRPVSLVIWCFLFLWLFLFVCQYCCDCLERYVIELTWWER